MTGGDETKSAERDAETERGLNFAKMQINVLTCSMWLYRTKENQRLSSFSPSKKPNLIAFELDRIGAQHVANLHGQNNHISLMPSALLAVLASTPPSVFRSRCECRIPHGFRPFELRFGDSPPGVA
jgi:hypothetical protein